MDRRLLAVPDALLLLVAAADVSVVGWEATFRAGAGLDNHPAVNATDLPARATASSSGEWALGETNCADRLAGVDDLRVDGESYRFLGEYSRDRLDRNPLAGLAKLGSGVAGVALLAVGLLVTAFGVPE